MESIALEKIEPCVENTKTENRKEGNPLERAEPKSKGEREN